jgi:hypothetical protein
MKQRLIVEQSATAFDLQVNKLLSENWYYVPDTFKALMSADGTQERYTILLVQDEESDELIAAIKQQMQEGGFVGGCKCQGDAHHGHTPPPFFQSPDEEPQSPECNPGHGQ